MNIQVVDIPVDSNARGIMWGRFSEALTAVEHLPKKKALQLGKLSSTEIDSLRSAARFRKLALHIRTTPEATFVWVNWTATAKKRKS